MALPDFAIIGAMKCGTTTLAAQLGAQDGVFVTTPKEPEFFSEDANYARGMDWYASLYQGAAPGDLTGEGSTGLTSYMGKADLGFDGTWTAGPRRDPSGTPPDKAPLTGAPTR